jgi:hypothetical protein
MQSIPSGDRRIVPDRRQTVTRVWDSLWGVGRRMFHRRRDEHAREYFVDRYSVSSLVLILLILIFSLVDAVITIHLLAADCGEANPLMAHLLEHGVTPFLIGKYILTAVGLPVLLVFQNFRLFGTRFRVSYLFPVFVALYIILLAYQISLLHTHAAL